MITEIFSRVNWVDVFVLIIIFRACYVALQTGFVVELFKLIGLIFALFFGAHYYTVLGDFLAKKIGLGSFMPLEFIDFLSFAALTVGINLVFAALRKTLLNTFKVEAPTSVNKWGGFALGAVRSLLYTGYVIFLLALSTVAYFSSSVASSYTGRSFFKVTPKVYSVIWNGVASKFMTNEKINENVFQAEKALAGGKK